MKGKGKGNKNYDFTRKKDNYPGLKNVFRLDEKWFFENILLARNPKEKKTGYVYVYCTREDTENGTVMSLKIGCTSASNKDPV